MTEPLCDRISRIAAQLEDSAGDLRGLPGVSRLRAALPEAVVALRNIADRVLEQSVALDELEQQQAEATGGEQVQGGGPDDSFAMVAEGAPADPARAVAEYWRDYAAAVSNDGRFTDWAQIAQVAAWILAAMDAESEQVQDGAAGRIRAFRAHWREIARNDLFHDDRIAGGPTPEDPVLTDGDLDGLLAERDALAARVAELEAEREADVPVVAALIEVAGEWGNEPLLARPLLAACERFADRIAALNDDADGGAQ